jgi:hypothetical protein
MTRTGREEAHANVHFSTSADDAAAAAADRTFRTTVMDDKSERFLPFSKRAAGEHISGINRRATFPDAVSVQCLHLAAKSGKKLSIAFCINRLQRRSFPLSIFPALHCILIAQDAGSSYRLGFSMANESGTPIKPDALWEHQKKISQNSFKPTFAPE